MNTIKFELEKIKKKCLVFDIETMAYYPGTNIKIDIRTDFNDYVQYAKCRFIGMYSYLHDEYVLKEVTPDNKELIKKYIEQHDILIGFNNEEFDFPILQNNDMIPEKRFTHVDCLITLGKSNVYRHDGLPFKNRGTLMGYNFKNNSLRAMAEEMKLETQKGDIDYNVFFQESFT